MNGFSDRPDDPDDVTIWAGRLRSWPANPPAACDEPDDDTVRSDRTEGDAPHEETVRSPRADAVEAVVGPPPVEPDEATVRSGRTAPDDDTVRVERGIGDGAPDRATPHLGAAADDTVITGRVSSRSAAVDDATVRVHPVEPDGAAEPDDATVRPRAVDAAARRADVPEDTAPGSRTRRPLAGPNGEQAVDELDDTTRPRRAPGPDSDDDTRAGSRRARRAEATRPMAATGPAIPAGSRAAHVPVAAERSSYAPRGGDPVRVERAAPVGRPTSSPDASAVHPRTARRGAWRVLLLAVAVVLVVGGAVTGVVLLLG